MNVEKMLEDARGLVDLLEHPEPGLWTWNFAVTGKIQRLNEATWE